MRRRVVAGAVIAVVVALSAAGCGKNTIRPKGAEKTVSDGVYEQTRFRPTDVTCPSGVEAKPGSKFDCHFTGPEGPYVAHMEIVQVHGERVLFHFRSERIR